MRLYAIRDRLIAYYQQPFIGVTDAQVKFALSEAINRGDNLSALAQTPHHFELWALANIDEETGNVKACPEFLCDVSSLVRDRVRESTTGGDPPVDQVARGHQGAPGGTPGRTGANGRPTQAPAPGPDTAPGTTPGGNPGGTDLPRQ